MPIVSLIAHKSVFNVNSFHLLDQICSLLLGVGALLDDPVKELAAGDPEQEGGLASGHHRILLFSSGRGLVGARTATVSQQENGLFQE